MSAKTKKYLITAGAIFGVICLAAAVARAMATSKSTGTPVSSALQAEVKSVTSFS